MADTKLTALTELTDIASTDLVYTVDDPTGTALSRKSTVQSLFNSINNLAEATTIDPDADFLLTYDTSASVAGKIKPQYSNPYSVGANQASHYTLAIGDSGGIVRMNSGSPNNLTVPPNTDVNFPIGTEILILQSGSGQTTLVAGTSVTLVKPSALTATAQYAVIKIVKILNSGTGAWMCTGDLN